MRVRSSLQIMKLFPEATVPVRGTTGSAGLDLFSREAIEVPMSITEAGCVTIGRALIATGIAVSIPSGCVGRIGSRSGLSVKHNIEVGAGWVDSDYRGEVMVELKNLGAMPFRVEVGARIAQLFIVRLEDVEIEVVATLSQTKRGVGGFGSTGTT